MLDDLDTHPYPLTVLRKHSDSHGRYILAGLRAPGFRAHNSRLPTEDVDKVECLKVYETLQLCE